MRRISLAMYLVFLALLVSACAAGTGSGSSSSRRNSNLITSQELSEVAGANTAYDAIQRLRPLWLTGRGGDQPRVFLDGTEMGGISMLRDFRFQTIREIRYTQPSDATMRYGTGYGGGVIDVITR